MLGSFVVVCVVGEVGVKRKHDTMYCVVLCWGEFGLWFWLLCQAIILRRQPMKPTTANPASPMSADAGRGTPVRLRLRSLVFHTESASSRYRTSPFRYDWFWNTFAARAYFSASPGFAHKSKLRLPMTP